MVYGVFATYGAAKSRPQGQASHTSARMTVRIFVYKESGAGLESAHGTGRDPDDRAR